MDTIFSIVFVLLGLALGLYFLSQLLLGIGMIVAPFEQSAVRKRALRVLQALPDFTTSAFVVSPYGASAIALDQSKRKVALVMTHRKRALVVGFSSLIEAEIRHNDATVTRISKGGIVGGALVGAALAGGVGALVGAMGASRHSEGKLSHVAIRLIVDSLEFPSHEVVLFEASAGQGVSENPSWAIEQADRWHGLLTACIKAEERNPSRSVQTEIYDTESMSKLPAEVATTTSADRWQVSVPSSPNAGTLDADLDALERLVAAGVMTHEEAREKAVRLVAARLKRLGEE